MSPRIAASCNFGEIETASNEKSYFREDTVQRMLDYSYTQSYHLRDDIDVSMRLTAHVRLYVAGDYYKIPTLKTLAVENFLGDAAVESWKMNDLLMSLRRPFSALPMRTVSFAMRYRRPHCRM